MRRWTVIVSALALSLLAWPSMAFAQSTGVGAEPNDGQSASAKLIVIHASNAGKGIDDSLKAYPELRKAPFSAYNTCKLLSSQSIKFDRKGKSVTLPDGGKLSISYLGKDGAKHQVQATIKKKNGDKFLPPVSLKAKTGQTFFLAGQPYQKGILVLGIRLNN